MASDQLGLIALALALSGGFLTAFLLADRKSSVAARIDRIRSGLRSPAFAKPSRASVENVHAAASSIWGETEEKELHHVMEKLGWNPRIGLIAAAFARIGLSLLAAVFTWLVFANKSGSVADPVAWAAGIVAAGLVWSAPRAILRSTESDRLATIESGLPEVLELLVICSEAGLSLEAGLDRTVVELRRTHPELAQELVIMLADLKIHPDRDAAFARLAERVPLPSVQSVVTTLSQTMRYGTPLALALRAVATELRDEALSRLEERANRLPVILTVPTVAFMLPALFLIVGGPALLRILDLFQQ